MSLSSPPTTLEREPHESAPPTDPPPKARPTQGQLHAAVWRLAWPSVTTMLLQTVNSMMDVFFVGHLPNSAMALAATGVGGGIIFLLVSLSMGISVGATALVARFTGSGDTEGRVEATGQAITLSLLLGALFTLLIYAFRVPLVESMLDAHRDPIAARLCIAFMEKALLGAVPLFVVNAMVGAMRGIGDARTPLLITAATVATHISGNLLFIYGNLGMPALGVAGAGAALSLSLFVGMGFYVVAIRRSPQLQEALTVKHLSFRLSWALRILKIGLPAAVQAVIRTVGMMSFTGMLAHALEGASGVAALQIGIRAESIAFMPGFGYSVAASTLVGQSLGARDPEKAERFGWAANLQAMIVMSVMACLFFVLADFFPRLFTQDAMVRELSANYLRINAFCEPFLALGMVLTGALQGAGDTIRPTFITLIVMWVLRMPLGWLLMFQLHQNAHGAWVAMCATTILGGLMTAALFRSGRWKRVTV